MVRGGCAMAAGTPKASSHKAGILDSRLHDPPRHTNPTTRIGPPAVSRPVAPPKPAHEAPNWVTQPLTFDKAFQQPGISRRTNAWMHPVALP